MSGYQLVYADPAWGYRDKNTNGNRGAACKYPVMSADQIAGMPVAGHVADDAVLALWATWPLMPDALRVMSAWGFEYRTCAFLWAKTRTKAKQGRAFRSAVRRLGHGLAATRDLWAAAAPLVLPSLHCGLGHHTRGNTEPVLLGIRGRGLPRLDKGVRQLVLSPLRDHSRKPGEVRHGLGRLYGDDVRRIELFARGEVPGWDTWGHDADAPVALDLEPKEAAT